VLAYEVATESFRPGGINRVILATDGDFNVGITNQGGLVRLIEDERESGVFLTVLGFGTGNIKDSTLETLADKGNGSYAYIDTLHEARKVLVEQSGSTLVTIAKDVKIQVEMNPRKVRSYRLIGYENRLLLDEDFSNDRKDAGDIGAGQSVTALYEIVPADLGAAETAVEPLRYQTERSPTQAADSEELMTVKLRYKQPDASRSRLERIAVADPGSHQGSANLRFTAAVAGFGMLLRDSEHRGDLGFDCVATLAGSALGEDPNGYRHEFVRLVRLAEAVVR
jgi:Ca-activated chloride channel family protein